MFTYTRVELLRSPLTAQLAGLHSNAYISAKFAKAFKTEGMKAYVEEIQRKEREIGCDVLTHQKWSGAELVDSCVHVAACPR